MMNTDVETWNSFCWLKLFYQRISKFFKNMCEMFTWIVFTQYQFTKYPEVSLKMLLLWGWFNSEILKTNKQKETTHSTGAWQRKKKDD